MAETAPLVRRGEPGGGVSRDLGLARDAWAEGDPEMSKQAHQLKGGSKGAAEDGHQSEGSFIKSVVFGGTCGQGGER